MAKIVLSADAPEGLEQVSLGNEVVQPPVETSDPEVISGATQHPFLDVEYEEVEVEGLAAPSPFVPVEDDVLSSENEQARLAFDTDAVKAFEASKAEAVEPVAVHPDEDQKEEKVEGGIATTVAASRAGASRVSLAPTTDDDGDDS